jgi:transposase
MRPTLQDTINRAICLLQAGDSIRKVAAKTGLSVGKVASISKQKLPDRKPAKHGRPALLSVTNQRFCVQKITKGGLDNAVKVRKQLESDLGISVSVDTVRRTLKAAGLGAIEKKPKPMLSKANIKKRLNWAKAHQFWTSDDWKRVIWSDETKINRFQSDGRVWAWIRDGETLKKKHTKMTVKHGGGGIMLWSAISAAGTGWMCQIIGRMDQNLYKEIIDDELAVTIGHVCENLGLRRDQIIFQQDNDPKHKSKMVMEHLQNQDYHVMEWPPQSPDLNPIENMWALLKRRLNEFDTAPKGMNELFERVTKVWYEVIVKEECQRVIDSMPKRVEQVIKRKGLWTDY